MSNIEGERFVRYKGADENTTAIIGVLTSAIR